MKKYILALDEGTTSTRAILFDRAGQIVSTAQREFPSHYPHPGWVEQDALAIYAAQYATLTESLVQCGAEMQEVAAIGITNQRETVVVWDRHTGKPLCPAIVWQCRRTTDTCEELERAGHAEYVRQTTGLRLDPYFSGTKIKWILDHVEGARERAKAGELMVGTVDTWLTWKLTEGRVFVTDLTNASRTMLFNINTLSWDEELLQLFGIPISMMPEVKDCNAHFGDVSLGGRSVPVHGVVGDQQSALFGQMCVDVGSVKNTYGTGCFLLMNTGEKRVHSNSNLLSGVA